MFLLSRQTISILRVAGWFPNRRIDITHFVKALQDNEHNLVTSARRCLEEFGDLSFECPWYSVPSSYHLCRLNAIVAAGAIGPEGMEDYQGFLGENLTPIGEYSDQILLMGESEHVFGVFGQAVVSYGKSSVNALNNLCEGRWPQVIRSVD